MIIFFQYAFSVVEFLVFYYDELIHDGCNETVPVFFRLKSYVYREDTEPAPSAAVRCVAAGPAAKPSCIIHCCYRPAGTELNCNKTNTSHMAFHRRLTFTEQVVRLLQASFPRREG
jgi:hypothetical protein